MGILKFHDIAISKLDLFKLSVLAQIEISDITSGGELAASIYGGWVFYQRYDLIWILNKKGHIADVLEMTWPLLKIEKIKESFSKISSMLFLGYLNQQKHTLIK